MRNVFVSYSRESKDIAATLAGDIKELGCDAWLDQELTGGQSWWNEILDTIRRCDVFVFVLTPHALSSIACTRECSYAAALGKPILPVLVSDNVSTNLLPPALAEIQFVEYRNPDRAAGFRLARALSSVPAAKPLPDPLPAPPPVPMSYLGSLNAQIEAPSTLSYEQQSALLVDLRKGLRDPETTADSKILLKRLRQRRDLLASIAEEIDEIAGSAKIPSQASQAKATSSEEQRPRERAPKPPEQPLRDPIPPMKSAQQAILNDISPAPSPRERSIGAGIGGIAGVIVFVTAVVTGNTSVTQDWLPVTTMVCAVSGALSGTRPWRMLFAAAGSVVGALAVFALWDAYRASIAALVLGFPGGSVIGVLIGILREQSLRRRALAP